jgi:hypothetical protein
LVELRKHSAQVDQWLGFEIEKVEKELTLHGCRAKAPGSHGETQNLWIGLESQNLLTPYAEIRRFLSVLNPRAGSTVVDLGAAYGRIGFVLGRHYPEVNFIGYEYVGERVRETQRLFTRHGFKRAKMEQVDLTSFSFRPPPAEYYFIYDYGTPGAIEKTLYDLRRVAKDRSFAVIAGGRLCHEAITWSHPWLEGVAIDGSHVRYSIFRANQGP